MAKEINREDVINWWDGLTNFKKDNLISSYFPQRHRLNIMNSEIVEIWKFENTPYNFNANTADAEGQEGESEALFHLSELVRTISRVANKFPDALYEDDLDRLTQAKAIMQKYSTTNKSDIIHPSNAVNTPTVVSGEADVLGKEAGEFPYFDENGKEIREFDLIKVFHFKGVNNQGRGRKNYYMYKWVRLNEDNKGKKWWVALHLNDDNNDYYHLRSVADKATRIIKGTEIIQTKY